MPAPLSTTALEVVVTLRPVPSEGRTGDEPDRATLAAAAVDGLLNTSILRGRGYRLVSVEGLEPCDLGDVGGELR